ncbi:ornithine cyclodeaminase family protein [Thalassococcus lentus]|uniref:Ornithine cyclodeaminase family protein n=1 Tax=Thalassococcus lentus TaxID=1210524 RepID=A0ABT4XTA6_9RHOB|nr:ornithine cyclodeaminase family protein [Thalassococcus lentus]MDA7425120.1 ornithine cyclodeaminase family protein [Thalassococcus lentus]
MPFSPRLFNDDDLKGLGIGPDRIVDCIEEAIAAKAAGRLITTPKSVVQPGDGRYMMSTLASGDFTVLKAVTVCPENPAKGLPSITGAIMVLDAHTGECRAVMDAEWITGVRTAGLSAVAAVRLADPKSECISFVGCGVQARSHLQLFAGLFPLKRIKAYGRGQANIDTLCALADDLGLQSEVCDTPDKALENADIVVTSIAITYSGEPFLDARLLKPSAFASVTDAAKPWIPASLDAFTTVVVDDRQQELSMPQPMVTADRIAADLTDLVSDGIAPGNGPRALLFRGIAVGDYALAAEVWRHANG